MKQNIRNKYDFFPKEIKALLNQQTKFDSWVDTNITKIKKRYNSTSSDDLEDINSELTCAFNLLESSELKELEYEPCFFNRRSPDFKATISNQILYIEVKRIRISKTENAQEKFINTLSSRLKKINQNYGISIHCSRLRYGNLDEKEIYLKLLSNIDNITNYIQTKLSKLSYEKNNDSDIKIDLQNFADNFYIIVSGISIQHQDGKVHLLLQSYNIPYSNKEFRKFADLIFYNLPQLIEKQMNIFYITADNNSFEIEDFKQALNEISKRDDDFFTKKHYKNRDLFINEFKKLSGVFFDNRFDKRKFWFNPTAYKTISIEVKNFLTNLNCDFVC